MSKTIVLYGRCTDIPAGVDASEVVVAWKDAVNFLEMAGNMISGEYEEAIVIPINSTKGCDVNAAVRASIDRSGCNFREFKMRLWLGDKPYAKEYHEGELKPVDIDWVAYIPCASMLTQ